MRKLTILVLEDDERLLEELSEYLVSEGFQVFKAQTPSTAMAQIGNCSIDIAIIDIKLPEYDGIQFLKKLKKLKPDVEAIMMSGHGDMENVIEAMRQGAFDYLRKPFSPVEMQISIERTKKFLDVNRSARMLRTICDTLQDEIIAVGELCLIGKSQSLREMAIMIEAAAKHPECPVLITGESGTGKELVARLIHLQSGRRNGRFLPVNCAAVPNQLFESEFFGHLKGSFTDAKELRKGFFRSADTGTLFLDEIGDMSYEAQTKLLRVIEDKLVKPIGSDEEVPADVRIICATNQPIEELMEQKKFRLDFYHRISVVEIHIPPLRERPEDIPLLATYFLKNLGQRMGRKDVVIDGDSLKEISAYPFPGNVRELKNMVEKALIIGTNPIVLTPQRKREQQTAGIYRSPEFQAPQQSDELNLEALERIAILKALEFSGSNMTKAAGLLGLSRQALDRRLLKYGLCR